jgi:hypothetical protein
LVPKEIGPHRGQRTEAVENPQGSAAKSIIHLSILCRRTLVSFYHFLQLSVVSQGGRFTWTGPRTDYEQEYLDKFTNTTTAMAGFIGVTA